MAQADLTFLADGLDIANIDRGVTAGQTVPNGGGTFVYGFNSLQVVTGAVALFANQANFVPMAKGGSVRAVVKRGTSGGPTGWAPFVFIGGQGGSVNDFGYLLGLQDTNPTHLCLRKGTIVSGLPEGTPDPVNNQILRRSTDAYAIDEWVHLRLDMVVNASGDTILKVFISDLAVNTVTVPQWETVAGMADFVDDSLGVNTGSAPFISGRAGYGHHNIDATRRSYIDQLEVIRQI